MATAHDVVPPSLADTQVTWFLEVLTRISTPTPDNHQLPGSKLLEIGPCTLPYFAADSSNDAGPYEGDHDPKLATDRATAQVVEYLSASNWSAVFSFVQSKLRVLREIGASGSGGSTGTAGASELESNALKGIGVLAYVWIDGRKLTAILKEICVYFLNLSKTSQNTIAMILPQTISRWGDNNCAEFVKLHRTEKRLDGSADILFDMSNSMSDEIHRRPFLWPFQTALVCLIPDVFRVVVAMGHAKMGTVSKKAVFLEGLRKSLGSPRASNIATFCLVGLCRGAHHFPVDSEAPLLSYALDVQNEIRGEIFDQWLSVQPSQEKPIDVHLITAAFITLSYLDLQSIVDHVIPKCFHQSCPLELCLAVLNSCNLIAQQIDADSYSPLFTAIAPHIWEFFQVTDP